MFGGKHEKERMEEVAHLKEELEKKKSALEEIGRQKDGLEEQFAALAVANMQMKKDLELVKQHIKQMTEFLKATHDFAEEVKQGVCYVREQSAKAEGAQDVFFHAAKDQKEKIMAIVENNKHFTTPTKVITEFPAEYREERERLGEQFDQMLGLSKSMGVLSLNAAIEAGKMGEDGKKFVASAEDIRVFSEEYETAVSAVIKHMEAIDGRIERLEEQGRYLSQLLKDNNVSMRKVLKESSGSILEYENHRCSAGNLAAKGVFGGLEDFIQKKEEAKELEEWLQQEVLDLADTFAEQRKCTEGMEQAFERVCHLTKEV